MTSHVERLGPLVLAPQNAISQLGQSVYENNKERKRLQGGELDRSPEVESNSMHAKTEQ